MPQKLLINIVEKSGVIIYSKDGDTKKTLTPMKAIP